MEKIKLTFLNIFEKYPILLTHIIIWGIVYLTFSFIAFTFNPLKWLFFSNGVGRAF